MSLALFHRPGTIRFVDDDHQFLEMLAQVMPRAWRCALHASATRALTELQAEIPFTEADLWLQHDIVSGRKVGTSLAPAIARYWLTNTERYALTSVAAVDALMPGVSGFELLGSITQHSCKRLLVTGQSDLSMAVSAFNAALIDRHMLKQVHEFPRQLARAVSALANDWSCSFNCVWRITLDPLKERALRNERATHFLRHKLAQHFVEYAVVGKPFGILGLDNDGHLGWLQLAFSSEPVSNEALLSAFDCTGQSWDQPSENIAETELWFSLFDLSEVTLMEHPIEGYGRWLARQPARAVAY